MEHVRTATKLLHIMLDAKYEKAYLNKFVETQFQQLTQIQRNELPEIITEVRRFFRWNTCHLGKISSRHQIKRGCGDNMLANISITEVTRGNVQKGG